MYPGNNTYISEKRNHEFERKQRGELDGGALEVGKGTNKWCNYFIISKLKKKCKG